jgi:hypothetical protein
MTQKTMDWRIILGRKTFWIYYLRLFQNFSRDRVNDCCDFFGVTKAELEDAILRNVYQPHRYDDENMISPTLSLPTTTGATLEIEFQSYGPNEQFSLGVGGERVLLASVDVDDVCIPCFPLCALPDVATRLRGDLAKAYGALLLYKLTYVTPEDDLDALATLLRMAFPRDLFTMEQQEHILASQQRAWRLRQSRPRPVHTIEHPAWQRLIEENDPI